MASLRDLYLRNLGDTSGGYRPVSDSFVKDPTPTDTFDGVVDHVVDADTVGVRGADGRVRQVRFANIDAQETGHGRNDPGQPLGAKQRDYLAKRVLGKQVRVGVQGQDGYGRMTGTLFDQDGADINKELVRTGNAMLLKAAPGSYGEAQAQANAEGLTPYTQPGHMTPSAFRHLQKGTLANPEAERGRFDTLGDSAFTRGIKQSVHGSLGGIKAMLADAADVVLGEGSGKSLREESLRTQRYVSGMQKDTDENYNFLGKGTAVGKDVGNAAGSVGAVGAGSLVGMAASLLTRGAVKPGTGAKLGGAVTSFLMNAGETSANAAADEKVMGSTTAAERLATAGTTGAVNSAIELGLGIEGKLLGNQLLKAGERKAGESFLKAAGRRAAEGAGRAAVGEGAEEGLQDMVGQVGMNSLRDKALYDIDAAQVGKSALSGAVGGAALGAAHNPYKKAPAAPVPEVEIDAAPPADTGAPRRFTPEEIAAAAAQARGEPVPEVGSREYDAAAKAAMEQQLTDEGMQLPDPRDHLPQTDAALPAADVAELPVEEITATTVQENTDGPQAVEAEPAQAQEPQAPAAVEPVVQPTEGEQDGLQEQGRQTAEEVTPEKALLSAGIDPAEVRRMAADGGSTQFNDFVAFVRKQDAQLADAVVAVGQSGVADDAEYRGPHTTQDTAQHGEQVATLEHADDTGSDALAYGEQEKNDMSVEGVDNVPLSDWYSKEKGMSVLAEDAARNDRRFADARSRVGTVSAGMKAGVRRESLYDAYARGELSTQQVQDMVGGPGTDWKARAKKVFRDIGEVHDDSHLDSATFERIQAHDSFKQRGFTLKGADGKPLTFSAHSMVMEAKDIVPDARGEDVLHLTARKFADMLARLLADPRIASTQTVTHSGTRFTAKESGAKVQHGNAAMLIDKDTGELSLDFQDSMIVRLADGKTPAIKWGDIKALANQYYDATAQEYDKLDHVSDEGWKDTKEAEPFADVGVLPDANRSWEVPYSKADDGTERDNSARRVGSVDEGKPFREAEAKFMAEPKSYEQIDGAPQKAAYAPVQTLVQDQADAEAKAKLREAEKAAGEGSTSGATSEAAQSLEQRRATAPYAESKPSANKKADKAFRAAMVDTCAKLVEQFAPGSDVRVVFTADLGPKRVGAYDAYRQTIYLRDVDTSGHDRMDKYMPEARTTLAHEFGHHLQWWTFDRETPAAKEAVFKAWLADLQAVLDAPTADELISRFGHPIQDTTQRVAGVQAELDATGQNAVEREDIQARARALVKYNTFEADLTPEQLNAEVMRRVEAQRAVTQRVGGESAANYRLGFSEWFANNMARHAETQLVAAATNKMATGFWAKLVKAMKEFFLHVKGSRLTPANQTFVQWLNENAERAVTYRLPPKHSSAHEPLNDASPAAEQARKAVASAALGGEPTAPPASMAATSASSLAAQDKQQLAEQTATDEANKQARDAGYSRHEVDPSYTATPEQQAEALEWLKEHVSKDTGFKAGFAAMAKVAGGVRYVDVKGVLEPVISLSTHALNPLSTAYHESMHVFVRELRKSSPEMAAALVRWAGHPATVSAMRAKLANSGAHALTQLEDPDERVAYAFQFYQQDPNFALPPAAQGFFKKLRDWINHVRKVLGLHSDAQKAERAMATLQSGAWQRDAGAAFADLNSMPREGALAGVKAFAEPVAKFAKKLLVRQIKQLSDTGIPAYMELANLLYAEHGADGKTYAEGYIQEVHRKHGQYISRMDKIATDLTREQFAALAGELRGVPSNDAAVATAAGKIHGILREMRQEMVDAGCDIGDLGAKYFPRVYNTEAMQLKRAEVLALFQKHKVANPEAVYNAITQGEDVENISGGVQAGSPGKFISRKLQLPQALTPELQALGVLDNDTASILMRYAHAAVKRAAYAKRFGKTTVDEDGNEHFDETGYLQELLQTGIEQGGNRETEAMAIKAVSAMQGTLGANIDPKNRNMQATIVLYENMRVLTTGILSQLPDVVGLAVKSGSPFDAVRALARAAKEAGGYWKEGVLDKKRGEQDYWEEMARAAGIIEGHYLSNAAVQLAGTSWTGGKVGKFDLRKLNDKFFAANFMTGWNNSNRVIATQVASERIVEWAQNPEKKHHARWLADLGLKPADVHVDAQGRLINDSEHVAAALHRWVDSAVLRPHAGHRPGWMNDPHFMVLAHLKQFMWTQQATLLRHMMVEAQQGNYSPMLSGVLMYATAGAMTLAIRGFVKGGGEQPEWMRNKSVGELALMSLDRSGLFGVRGLVMDTERDWSRGELISGSLVGPALKQATDAIRDIAEGEVDNVLVHAAPTQDLWGGAALPHTERALNLLIPFNGK